MIPIGTLVKTTGLSPIIGIVVSNVVVQAAKESLRDQSVIKGLNYQGTWQYANSRLVLIC